MNLTFINEVCKNSKKKHLRGVSLTHLSEIIWKELIYIVSKNFLLMLLYHLYIFLFHFDRN